MIKAEIDKELNLVKVDAEGNRKQLESELIAILIDLRKTFSKKDLREMLDLAEDNLLLDGYRAKKE